MCIYDIAQGKATRQFPCTGSELDIAGNQVAALRDGDVALYDLTTGARTQLTPANGHQITIADGRIAWSECCSIAYYDLATRTRVGLSGPSHQPAIAGDTVVWGDCWSPSPTVWLLDLSHGVVVTDVPAGYWALHEIQACVSANVVKDYDDGLYHPEAPVTRDQMAVYISRALVTPSGDAAIPDGPATPTFSDVPADHWAYRYIEYAASQNVVQGYPGGAYRPEEMMNRGQMAVCISRGMVAPAGDAGVPAPAAGQQTFSDVSAGNDWSWCYRQVEYLAAGGVVQGYWDHTYHPERQVTRGQMAVYIQRAFELPM